MTTLDPLIAAHDVVKGYRTAAGYVPVLAGVDLHVAPREMVAIVGASGVGKSTLLHVLGSLDRPESGRVVVAGQDVFALDEDHLREFRNRTLGLMMPMLIARRPLAEARDKAKALLEDLGLGHRAEHRPGAMSGGEQQRVAVARALVQSPRALLGDEPSGNLDQETGERLHALLRRLNQEKGITVVVVTHNERLAAACDRVLRLEGGRLHDVPP